MKGAEHPWTSSGRCSALARAAEQGVDLLVIGGGITGAGVLRDAASRGLRCLLVERDDFASGTSSRSSKMIHGGFRYIAEGQLRVTREACRERDLLLAQNPSLVRPLPFLLPAFEGGKLPMWQVRAGLLVYSALANFRRSARSRVLSPPEIAAVAPDLRSDGLLGAGLYNDAQVDDVRLVLESLKSARSLGAECVNRAELLQFEKNAEGRLSKAIVRDRCSGDRHRIAARAFVNAAGPSVERVRGIDQPGLAPELRPAKGVHLVIPRSRVRTDFAVAFEAPDRRLVFLAPWDEVALLGTTDSFSDEIDEPVVHIEEVHYLLAAANAAFPLSALTTNDLLSVFAGVRPLAASADEQTPPSSVSREHRIYTERSGLVSAAGGKLTTYRAMGEAIVDRVVAELPRALRATLSPSRTRNLPLRAESFDPSAFGEELAARFGMDSTRAAYLVRSYGREAETLLQESTPMLREPIGRSRYCYAELPWSWRNESPASLCDLLERRLRLPIFGEAQGLPQLGRIAQVVADAAGWDAERRTAEAAHYAEVVRRRYQIAPPGAAPARSRAGARAASAAA